MRGGGGGGICVYNSHKICNKICNKIYKPIYPYSIHTYTRLSSSGSTTRVCSIRVYRGYYVSVTECRT